MGRSQPVRADDFVAAVVRLFEPCGPQPPAAEARKRAPQAAPDIPYEVTALTFAVKPLFRILRRIPPSDCFLLLLRATATRRRESWPLPARTAMRGHRLLPSPAASMRACSTSIPVKSIRSTQEPTAATHAPCAASSIYRSCYWSQSEPPRSNPVGPHSRP